MKVMPPPLLPIFRSEVQVKILSWLLLHPEREESITSLAERLEVPWATVQRELGRLIGAGVLAERILGRARLLSANTESPYYHALSQIIGYAFGPAVLVAEAFDGVPGITKVMIIGSWAERYLGTPGPPPRDVDVVVVGDPARRLVRRLNEELEARLGRPVQITVTPTAEWREAKTGFVREVLARPYMVVVDAGEGEEGCDGAGDAPAVAG
jgi:DNA-binding transcriptional ArsR family regulator